jgi:hypothetical protein
MTLKIFTYNVYMRDQLGRLEHYNNSRARAIANFLAHSDYDVLVFQEAFDDGARNELYRILGPIFQYRTTIVGNEDDIKIQLVVGGSTLAGFVFGALAPASLLVVLGAPVLGFLGGAALSWLTGKPKSDGGVFMMSRWPIQLQGQILYKQSAGYDRFGKKGVSWALIDKLGFHFNVYGTHTQSEGEREIRTSQFKQLRAMYEATASNWQPALIAGDLNVDYCFERDRCPAAPLPGGDGDGRDGPVLPRDNPRDDRPGRGRDDPPGPPTIVVPACCKPDERVQMLGTLGASVPGDLSKYVYTDDPANDVEKRGTGLGRCLDYVLHAQEPRKEPERRVPLRPQPRRASLETIKPRGMVGGRERDLSDHYGVLGTYTYPFVREDSDLFTGTWRCINFNNRPDTRNHRVSFTPFGKHVLNEFQGQPPQHAYVYQLYPGREDPASKTVSGRIIFGNIPAGTFTEYEYFFKPNPTFSGHFTPTEIQLPRRGRTTETRNRSKNELLLRNARQSMLYAFEHWPPIGIGDDFRPGGPV